MAHWLDPQPIDVPPAVREVVGGRPLVAEALARRGVLTPGAARAFLHPSAYTPAAPSDLPDLPAAAERLRQAINLGERIAIWGDFDADGQTATALLLDTMRAMGGDVTYRIPARQEGHGLRLAGVEQLIKAGAQVVVTCDTGITAHEAVARANALGATVIITDHHVPAAAGHDLPPAFAAVNPHRLPAGHPMATLTGVGVSYELSRALDPDLADRGLDLVALGTVADVGTLRGDARYLVQRGLESLRHTERAGLQAMYETADLRQAGISEEHIGFVLGPRLNALGRLANAALGVELLTTGDRTRARILANEIEGLNAQRQWLAKQVTDAALGLIERQPALLSDFSVLVLSHPTWPPGIVGVVAGRLVERFGKPAVLISAPPGQPARGSGRSVPGLDIIAALKECAPLLGEYGGHAGAAGFSLEAGRIPELRAALSRAVAGQQVPAEPTLTVDGFVELSDLTLDLVADISRLAPFGPGNPLLTLAVRDLRVLSDVTIGRTAEHRRLIVEDGRERTQTVFWWQGAGRPLPQGRLDLAVTLRANDYRGLAEIQVEWVDARARPDTSQVRESGASYAQADSAPGIVLTDHRRAPDAVGVLRSLVAQDSVQIWAEGDGPPGFEARGRHQLVPGPRLAIWTLPPGPRELSAVLAQVRPLAVYLFAHDPGLDHGDAFTQRLAGLVRFALRAREGRIDLAAAAAATAQRIGTVQAGLDWLAAQGQIAVALRESDCWQLEQPTLENGYGERGKPRLVEAAQGRLTALLAETAAYRTYLRTVPAHVFLEV